MTWIAAQSAAILAPPSLTSMLRSLLLAALFTPLAAAQPVRVELTPHTPDARSGAYSRAALLPDGSAELRWRDRPATVRVVVDGDSLRADGRAGALTEVGNARVARVAVDGVGVVEARVFESAVLYRLADQRVGTARLGGAEVPIALQRGSSRSRFDDRASLAVDLDGDGAFRTAAVLDSLGRLLPRERVDSGEPVWIGGRAVVLDSVAADGSALWLRLAAATAAPEPGFTAPDVAFAALDGGSAPTLAELRGRTVVLVWWSTTCTFCEEARPATNAAAASYADDPEVVWLAAAGAANVTMDESAGPVEAFLAARPYTAPVVLAPAAALGAYAVDGYPRYVVVAPDGRVVFDESGSADARMDQLRAAIEVARRTAP